jgi:hypothetical protein
MKGSRFTFVPKGRRLSVLRCALSCVLASSTCVPALADTATFSVSGNMTFAASSIPNITYTLISNENTITPSVLGDAELTYGGQYYSWNGGTLSYQFDQASGSISPPTPFAPASVAFTDEYDSSLQITNTSSTSIEVPITLSVGIAGNATSIGDPYGATYAYTQTDIEVFDVLEPAGVEVFGMDALCSSGTPDFECSTYSYPGTSATGFSSPVTYTADFLAPANSVQVLDIFAQTLGEAGYIPNAPEPGTFTLLATGVLLLSVMAGRKHSQFLVRR